MMMKPYQIADHYLWLRFSGKDVTGLAQTGYGKTGAFALPILHALLEAPRPKDFFACVLSPTRFDFYIIQILLIVIVLTDI